jgi:cytochrome c peroxidase
LIERRQEQRGILSGFFIRSALLPTAVLGLIAVVSCQGRPAPATLNGALPSQFTAGVSARIDSLDQALAALDDLPKRSTSATVRQAFAAARAAYKRLEYLVEFEDPLRTRALNSPPITILDEDDHTHLIRPTGLQVIEASIYPSLSRDFAKVTRRETTSMRLALAVARNDSSRQASRTWQLPFQAARMELARVATLGLAGYDATLSEEGVHESAYALRGITDGLKVYQTSMLQRDSVGWRKLQQSLDAAINVLQAAPSFNGFDRFEFIARYASPIAHGLARLQRSLGLPNPSEPTSLLPGATDIYAAGSINSQWFAPDYAPRPTPELLALGRRLFFDTRLSAARRRSCATCHQPAFAFTDRRRVALVDPGHGRVRNTPTLLNAGLQRSQFFDQRSQFLEFQFEEVMANPREMALAIDSAARRLAGDTALVNSFADALRTSRHGALTGKTLSLAVAAYVRSLQALNSRFDRAIRGDTGAITTSERRGFNIFMGKAACGTCHFAPLFGGTLPPAYLESEPEVIGVPERPTSSQVDGDLGVFALDRAPIHRHAFKTPTVRNVALTAPYMHNGVFRSLEEVVDFYDRGGGNGRGMRLPNQTLTPESLHLTRADKRDLIAFLRALTDTSSVAPVMRLADSSRLDSAPTH